MSETNNDQEYPKLNKVPQQKYAASGDVRRHLDEIHAVPSNKLPPRTFRAICIPPEIDVETLKTKLKPEQKIVHFLRHGEGTHNLAAKRLGIAFLKDQSIADARLTELGRNQASNTRPYMRDLCLDTIFVSPLTRALETASLACVDFKPSSESSSTESQQPVWYANEWLRCSRGSICDRRRSKEDISKEFPHVNLKYLLSSEDPQFISSRESKQVVAKRGYQFLQWIFKTCKTDTSIAVVCHSGFLFTLFNAVLCCEGPSAWNPNPNAMNTVEKGNIVEDFFQQKEKLDKCNNSCNDSIKMNNSSGVKRSYKHLKITDGGKIMKCKPLDRWFEVSEVRSVIIENLKINE